MLWIDSYTGGGGLMHEDSVLIDRPEWKPTVVLYHGNCIDGFTAAWCCWRKWGSSGVRYEPVNYGEELPRLHEDDRVLMVDFSLKRREMEELAGRVKCVIVLDHHVTAEVELAPFSAPPVAPNVVETAWLTTGVHAFFDMGKSGARMAWEFCFPAFDAPELVSLVEDRDLWRFKYGDDTRALHRYLGATNKTFDAWSMVNSSLLAFGSKSKPLSVGLVLLADHENRCRELVTTAHTMFIGPVDAMAVNAPYWYAMAVNAPYWYASDVGHMLLEEYPHTPFSAVYSKRRDGKTQFSLRSRDDRLDVSVVAASLGGGGHRNSAGFVQ